MNRHDEVIKIAVVDDHSLFRKGMINLVQSLDERFKVIMDAANGEVFLNNLISDDLPDIVLLDINMPHLDGFATVQRLQISFPDIDILVISMIEKEESIVRMLKLGVKGYLSKDVEPADLKKAILSIKEKGYYYTDFITGKLVHELKRNDYISGLNLSEREKAFLELVCTELTYKQIADKMHLSVKTIDIYRDALFKKFETVSRVGLVVYAIKNNLVRLN
jgi:two-component system, NarL family, invasion response regulator UvrY